MCNNEEVQNEREEGGAVKTEGVHGEEGGIEGVRKKGARGGRWKACTREAKGGGEQDGERGDKSEGGGKRGERGGKSRRKAYKRRKRGGEGIMEGIYEEGGGSLPNVSYGRLTSVIKNTPRMFVVSYRESVSHSHGSFETLKREALKQKNYFNAALVVTD